MQMTENARTPVTHRWAPFIYIALTHIKPPPVLHHAVVCVQEDVHQDEAYTDGPSNSALPDHWRDFSEAAAAAGRSSNSATAAAGRRALTQQDSQVMGLTGMPAAAAQPAGADTGKVSSQSAPLNLQSHSHLYADRT
jgi:hypothetical protein